MDVSNTGHSHIIGKGGKTVNSVMSEMGCRIHFPDSNLSNPYEKNNKVSIFGDDVKGIEKARAKVRELVPLVLTFDFLDTNFNANDPLLRSMQDQFNIKLMFLLKANHSDTTTAIIKGHEFEAGTVKKATQLLIDHISGKKGNPTPVTMNMEISPNHHSFVLGQNNDNLRVIMQITNTNILFPDAADSNILPIKKGSVSITGKFNKSFKIFLYRNSFFSNKVCPHFLKEIFINFLTSTLLCAQNMTLLSKVQQRFFKFCGLLRKPKL